MRAFTLDSFDSAPRFRDDLPVPAAGADDLLVRVQASSVNPADAAIASGMLKGMAEYKFPVTLGRDFAGAVEQVGANVSQHAAGDAVYGFVRHASPAVHEGSWADYAVVPQGLVARKPASVDVSSAGVAPVAGLTAIAGTRCPRTVGRRERSDHRGNWRRRHLLRPARGRGRGTRDRSRPRRRPRVSRRAWSQRRPRARLRSHRAGQGSATPRASMRFSTSCPSLPMPPCSRRAGGWPPPLVRPEKGQDARTSWHRELPRTSSVSRPFSNRCAAREDPRHVSARASRQRLRLPHGHPHAGEAGHRERLLTRHVCRSNHRPPNCDPATGCFECPPAARDQPSIRDRMLEALGREHDTLMIETMQRVVELERGRSLER